jgi:molybdopterin-containing oxidoreductase family iron-sulfur binding subunit
MSSKKKYWKSTEELDDTSKVIEKIQQNEFAEHLPIDLFADKQVLENSQTSRRDFLKYLGFSTAAASLVACEGPVAKTIPYLIKPDDITPGIANYYATAIADGFDFSNLLVKVREGRPIKIAANKEAKGTTNARIQASVLSLYDKNRLQFPKKNGKEIGWDEADKQIIAKLKELDVAGLPIVFLSSTHASPSTNSLLDKFKNRSQNSYTVLYDAISENPALEAMEAVYGKRALPTYHFEKATAILSIGADFLGDWQGGAYQAGYAKGRIPKNGKMSRHVQFESNMTLTGANADERIMLTHSQQKLALLKLYNLIVKGIATKDAKPLNLAVLKVAKELKAAGKNALLVTGIQDKNAQILALEINRFLKSEVIAVSQTRNVRMGNSNKVKQLVKDMNAGKIGAVIVNHANPVYTLPFSQAFVEGLKKVPLSISCGSQEDETSKAVEYALATPHYLESWGDVEMTSGTYSLMQPTINPLFNTRQFQDNLLKWLEVEVSYNDYLKDFWNINILKGSSWNKALHDGFFVSNETSKTNAEVVAVDIEKVAADFSAGFKKGTYFELQLYTKQGLGDGQMANNPWLQEFPDPITRVTWDNYLTVSQKDATDLGLENTHVANGALNGSKVQLTVGGTTKILPVIIQPGQAPGSFGLAFGYGRKEGLKVTMKTGENAFEFYQGFEEVQTGIKIEKVEGMHEFACIQLHNTLMGRGDIIKETDLETFNDASLNPTETWNKGAKVSLDHKEVKATSVDLWTEFDRSVGHHFNLSIDLNACTGCGACVIACQAENNVPVVGKQEMRKSRDMHWLRIDRYYSHEESFEEDVAKKNDSKQGYRKTMLDLESPASNPSVAFQPVMCQHCNHAPCETVCPVAATTHSRQGQNHMAYNRCVGTRYCANNCPYKVRRFNWFKYSGNKEFDYHMNDDLGKMVLNPDVTVRSRGVMEKCSLCIQMTQSTILNAKKERRKVKTNEFEVACANACDTNALVFGDVNNPEDEVVAQVQDQRAYHLLEHLGVRPNVVYQVKVKNEG